MVYPSAKIIIKDQCRPGEILLVERNVRGSLSVEPAGGKAEVDHVNRIAETFEECAIREAREELGYTVKITQYLGSYHFFWTIDPHKCSICALFEGTIVDRDPAFVANADTCELPIRPVWVRLEDIFENKVTVDPCHKGLRALLLQGFTMDPVTAKLTRDSGA